MNIYYSNIFNKKSVIKLEKDKKKLCHRFFCYLSYLGKYLKKIAILKSDKVKT